MFFEGRETSLYVIVILCGFQCNADDVRSWTSRKTQINLLDSYIPAAMQVIAHLTESMKYDLKPPTVSTSTSVPSLGSIKPTSTHKPGVYAPVEPPSPESYTRLGENQAASQKIQSGILQFSDDLIFHSPAQNLRRTTRVETALHVENEELPENLENLIGDGPASLIKFINSPSFLATSIDPDEQVQIFSKDFDDSDFRMYLEKNKKAPPTRAYVTLLSLYDLLSKDAKKQGYNKFQGFHQHVLVELSKTSSGSSADQLKFVLEKILSNQDTNQPNIVKKIQTLLEDLKMENSYINMALMFVPPLKFTI
ncbi:hypothetical protein HHI36_021625 [Cryptolaemus montrouzieri]|uniref:Uncharacterized protein n=1 Tax=Cryptolaemus montrouzieri TaxID=559131 RepID=A0ABD2MXC7_9CUCU